MLYVHTVFDLEPTMKHDFRQFYQPQTSRPPRWLRRIWLWF
jgi:hypothetical protein